MRYSPLVLIINSGSGNSLVHKYFSKCIVVNFLGFYFTCLYIERNVFNCIHQFPPAAIAKCHYQVQPSILAGHFPGFLQFVECIFRQHIHIANHMQLNIILIQGIYFACEWYQPTIPSSPFTSFSGLSQFSVLKA